MEKHELWPIVERRHSGDRRDDPQGGDLHDRIDQKLKQIEMERRQVDRRRTPPMSGPAKRP